MYSNFLTLFDMGGGHDAPPKVFHHCAQRLSTEHQKVLLLVSQVIQCYHCDEFVRKYWRISEVIIPYVS